MKKTTRYVIVALALLGLALLFAAGPLDASGDPRIDARVWQAIDEQGRADVLILLKGQPDLSPAYALPGKEAKGRWVYDTLRRAAETSQRPLLAELERRRVPYQRFWAVPAVRASIDAETLTQLLALPSVKRVQADLWGRAIDPQPVDDVAAASVDNVSWGVARVEAPWAWDHGYTGAGVVVAGQDTGYDWDHPALKQSFRGYDAGTGAADFNYNWHDSVHEDLSGVGSNPCGYDSPVPCDDHGHGTHTMGTMVGNDLARDDPTWPGGAENVVGVAPGAEWIACRNMERGVGKPSTYIECFEWLIAPYPLGGDPMQDGDPGKAPDVINNSWSCPPPSSPNPDVECEDDKLDILEPAVNAADAAGIVVVVSAGNYGTGCETVVDPPAIYPRAFAAGATTSSDDLADFSSRGAATYQGETLLKPQIAAPGAWIRSSLPNDSYGQMSGTSMAAPHTAAVIALLLDAEPSLRGHTNMIKAIVSRTAEPVIDFACGGDSTGRPNNRFGWGIVNARRAIESLSAEGVLAGRVADQDENALVGVVVSAFDTDGKLVMNTVTDKFGAYSMSLPWGEYKITFERVAFDAVEQSPVYVVGGQTTQINAQFVTRLLHMPLILK